VDPGFQETQDRYFAHADDARFRWTTSAPGFSETEEALLAPLLPLVEKPALEIGCGEGGNFVHVGGEGLRIGVDAFPAKLAFAGRSVEGVRFVGGDAAALPLASHSMRTVLVRDVLHHLADPAAAVAEALAGRP